MPTLKIKGILTRLYSIRDRNGNVYNAFRYVDTQTGKTVEATSDGNIDGIALALETDKTSVLYQEIGMGQRAFFHATKAWPYAGCKAEDQATWIKTALKT